MDAFPLVSVAPAAAADFPALSSCSAFTDIGATLPEPDPDTFTDMPGLSPASPDSLSASGAAAAAQAPEKPQRKLLRAKVPADITKTARHERRLALNRQSAAVSRLKRRQYIADLETRLARVETEKHELLERMEVMMYQNREMSRQLGEAFELLASRVEGHR